MSKRIGFIGCGNMAVAMIGGMIKSKIVTPEQFIVSNRGLEKLMRVKEMYQVETTQDNKEVARVADVLFLAVKPNQYQTVIDEIKEEMNKETIVVSIAAGQSIATIEKAFGFEVKLIRSMPNTPALVQEGMSALIPNVFVSEVELFQVRELFNSFGKSELISEDLMDSFIAVSGSSPAYVYLFIEAMADAAVLQGIPREQAYRFAAQAVLGAAKMVLESGAHPGALKDAVCSPGGTTIEAVVELEKSGMRASVMKAMEVCAAKGRALTS